MLTMAVIKAVPISIRCVNTFACQNCSDLVIKEQIDLILPDQSELQAMFGIKS